MKFTSVLAVLGAVGVAFAQYGSDEVDTLFERDTLDFEARSAEDDALLVAREALELIHARSMEHVAHVERALEELERRENPTCKWAKITTTDVCDGAKCSAAGGTCSYKTSTKKCTKSGGSTAIDCLGCGCRAVPKKK